MEKTTYNIQDSRDLVYAATAMIRGGQTSEEAAQILYNTLKSHDARENAAFLLTTAFLAKHNVL